MKKIINSPAFGGILLGILLGLAFTLYTHL